MATHRKVYRFRMRPTRSQEQSLNRLAGARRWVWNWGLARWKETYAATGKSISLKQLSAELTALKEKPETAWLKEADSQSLQQVLNDLHRAFTNFFEKRVNGELTLSDRHWVCRCGMVHDRDGSAAINIRDEGLRILAEGHSDKSNARGAGVRPPMEAVGVEPRIPRL